MDFEKLADKFIEEGGWQGSPRIAIELFAKWLAEQEAAQQSVQLTCYTMGIVSMYLMGSIARIVKKRSYRTQVAQTVGRLLHEKN